MKKLSFLLLLGLIALQNSNAQLNGSYTIGSSGDYTTFGNAITALKTQGVSGPVTFTVATGIYNEQFTFGKIPGQGFSNRITFESQTGNPADVTLFYSSTSSTDNYIIKFDSATHITFQNLTFTNTGTSYARNIDFKTGTPATGIQFLNNIFNSGANNSSSNKATIYTSGAAVDSCLFQGNTFNGGYAGISMDGPASPLSKGVLISNNIFYDHYYSIYLKEMDAPVISSNTLVNPTSRGIFLEYCDNLTKITSNKINSTFNISGIYFNQSDGTLANRGLIANNFVQVGATSNSSGIQINTCTYQNLYHNTVSVTGTTTGNSAVIVTSGSDIQINNNIFSCENSGYALNTNSATAITTSDYNNFYSPSNYMFYRTSTEYRDLSEYKTASSKETNSVSFYPGFKSSTDLHVLSSWLNGMGTVVSIVTDDFDGELRNNPPDIGADEYTPYTNSPLSGSYTLGSGGDFPTFKAAIDTLKLRGISSSVTFDVLNGDYFESLELIEIPGINFQDSVIFQSQSGNPVNVTIDFSATSASDNYLILFKGADRFSFMNMTLNASGSSGYNTIANFYGYAKKNKFLNCIMNGGSNSSSYNYSHLYANGSYLDSTTISGCTINNGYGFYLFGPSNTELATDVTIVNNTFSGSYNSIFLEKMSSPKINGNTFLNSTNDAIHLQYCDNDLQVLSNTITSNSDKSGIYLYNCDGISAKRGLIANNFIQYGSTGNAYGIYLNTCTYENVYHNSINLTGTSTSSASFYGYNGSNLQLKNNVFANTGSGYALNTNSSTNISATDYNNFFTNGNYIANWGSTAYNDLASLKTASGKDVNSISVNPGFFSNINLHTNSYWLDGKGTPLAVVTTDYDGSVRDGVTPDIGADEFTSSIIPLNGTYTIGTTGDFPSFANAIDSLNLKGVSGPVIFDVLNGTYNEQFILKPVSNASAVNTITFQSQSGIAGNVVVDFNATSSSANYVAWLAGVSFITLQNMTFTASSTNSNAVVIYLTGNATYNQIKNCLINGKSSSSAIWASSCQSDNLTISGNTINGGYHSINLQGVSTSVLAKFVSVTLNTINSSSYNGIYLQNQDAPVILSNQINSSGQDGIRLEYCDNALQVLKNKIYSQNDYSGIVLQNCDGTTSSRGLISNNFITIGNNGNANGVYTYYSNYQNVYHNSINIITGGSGTSSAAFKGFYGSNINVVNNILLNNGPGFSYYVNNSSVAGTSDFNCHSSKGNFLAYWSANVLDLEALKTASSKESSSINVSADFVSVTDLHISSYWLDNKGTPLTDVSDDIDGEVRNAGTPDIGADEFTSTRLPLAGTYIVGTGGNFTTLTEAADSLNILGVSDSVFFLIKSGTYFEQFELKQISGADSVHPIQFQSQTGNAIDVVISFTATSGSNNHIIMLSSADNITFKNLTFSPSGIGGYAKAFYIYGVANNITFDNCIFNGATGFNSVNTSLIHVDNSNPKSLLITGCTFNNGGYGLYFTGISTSNPAKILTLSNNVFNYQYYPVSINYGSGIYLKSNVLNEIKNDGFYLGNCSGEIKLEGNKIYGISDYTGINFYSTNGTAPSPVLIANNFVSYGSAGSSYGIYLYSSNFINVYNNTVHQRSSSSSSIAFYTYGGSNINVLNNIFCASGTGYAYYSNNGTNILNSDYNNLYSNGSYLAYWSVNQVNLSSLQSASGKDLSSLSLFPSFVSISDLHLKSLGLNNKGTYLTDVLDDIDGESRDTLTPDIGADEFNSGAIPLAGVYTIGPTGYFSSITQAVDSLTMLGISDSVIFKIQTGTYNEKIELNAISGVTAVKYVVFESQTGNATDVVIFNAATSTSDNFIFNLKNAKYFNFRKLTFKATGISYASIFTLSGETRKIKISECVMEGKPFVSGYEQALIRSYQTVIDSITVISNKMTNGAYGVYLYGINTTNPISGINISGNEFNGFYYSIYLSTCDAPVVEKNKMTSFQERAIHIETCANATWVHQNFMVSDNAYYGIVLYNSNGTPGAYGITSNNMIYLGSNGNTRGIYLENSSYQNIYHNSVHITGTNTSSSALLVSSGSNINVVNNVLSNSGAGYSYYVNTTSAVQTSDFNDLYVKGAKLGYWSTDQTNLAAFKTASGKEVSSVSVDPMFESKTDLHASAIEIYEKGTPLTAITYDIEGELRDAVKPDIGADEIYCTNPLISMKADTVCNGDTSLILNLSTGLRTWSTFKWDILNDGSIDMTTKDSIYYKFDSTGNYPVKLIISNPIGCVDSLVGLVPVVSPSADAGLSTAICRGSKVQLKASTGKSYKWWPSTGLSDTTISNPYASPVLTSTYYVEVVENSGCISVDSVTVFVKSVPVAYAGLDTVINFGDSITISAAPGGEFYAWDNGMTGMTISVAPAFSRSYSVFVTKNGCGAKDEITIFVDNSPLPSFSFTNKLFGILPEGPVGPDNCSSAAYLGISTIDPGTGTQIYGQCSNQVSTTYSGVTADRFRMIFGDQNLTYHENVDANRQKMIYTEGTASLQMDTTGSGTWKNILSLKNVSTIIEFICPDTLKGKMRGEISGGDPAFYAEYTSTGNNQILAEFTSLAIDSIYNDSLGNKLYTVYDYTFELLPVEKPVYVKGLGIVAPGDLLTFPSTGVSLDFNAYIASSDSASATVVYYPFDPPYTQAEDTIATVFNNEFWELGSTLDNFQVQVCFDYDSNEINTSDIQYLNLVYQEYIGGPWTIVSGVPVISGDQICVVTEHFSNWSLAITKPDARVKIDTIFSNQGADPEFVYKKFEDELNVGLKLTPGQNQNVEFRAFALNPGGDLPAGVKKFSETYWELHSDSDIESILEFNPASLAGYDSTTDDGKYTILYRPDAVTDWSALPTSRVRRGMKEVLIVKQSNLVSPTGERNYVLGNVDTVLELFSSSANVSPVCEGVSSQFMAQVSGGISPFSYSWTGDDGFTSTMETPEYTYPSGAGNYNYTLIVTDANGAETTFSGVAKVNALPQLLVSNDTLICKGESVTLTVSGAQDYFWNTGDSTSTIFTIPSNSSVYIVTGTDSNGCSSESVISVNVNTETAGISMPDTALTSELISFLNSSTGGTEWHWDFGDGNTSTEQNPQYSYSAIGTYPVCLTVDGCDSVCKSIIIKLKTSLDNVLQKQGYVVFPNPAGKKLNVVFNSQDYANTLVTLSDIYGKIIYKELAINRNENQQLQIDLSEISTGIYFLKIQTAKGSNIEKVVVR